MGLRLDGFTTRVIREGSDLKRAAVLSKDKELKLMGNRFFTLSTVVRVNQKGTRPHDEPIDIGQLNADEKEIIKRRYPELC